MPVAPVPLNRWHDLGQRVLAGGQIITDANNPVSRDFAETEMVNRRYVVEALPGAFFMN